MPVIQSVKAKRFMNIYSAAQKFQAAAKVREKEAADGATLKSRSAFTSQLSGRPLAPARSGGKYGRPTTAGKFADFIEWAPDGNGYIVFDEAALQGAAPYFMIQEIGTGKTATILNPHGTVSVRSQAGRTIAFTLFWASGPGGSAAQAGSGGLQQLYLKADLSDVAQARKRRKRIRREIHGKHYLQAGGIEGFVVLADGLLVDMKRIFG